MMLKCPFCSCEFCCQYDLDRHLDAFGRDGHLLKFRKLHESVKDESSLLHVGADRVVLEIARKVKRSRGFSG